MRFAEELYPGAERKLGLMILLLMLWYEEEDVVEVRSRVIVGYEGEEEIEELGK